MARVRPDGSIQSAQGRPSVFLGYRRRESALDDGIWLEWNASASEVAVANDSLGMRPAFYFVGQDTFGVATHVVDLLASGAPAEIDDEALAVFLRLGYFVGDDTPFRAIRALGPNASLNWNGTSLQATSASPPTATVSHLSMDEAAETFGQVLEDAVRNIARASDGPVVLPLSGGRDSRHIMLALLASGRPPDVCVTHSSLPPQPDHDVSIAKNLAARFGLRHVVLPQSGSLIAAERDKNILTSFCSDEHLQTMVLRSYLDSHPPGLVIDGIGGDVLAAGLYLDADWLRLYEAGRLRDLADAMLREEDVVAGMLGPAARRRWPRALAIDRLVRELALHAAAPNPVSRFLFWNRTRREIALSPWALLCGAATVVAPFLSPRVVELLTSLPASYFIDQTFHSDAIQRRYPGAADFPYAGHGWPSARGRRRTIDWWTDVSGLCRRAAPGVINFRTHVLPRVLRGLVDPWFGVWPTARRGGMAVYLTDLARMERGGEPAWRGALARLDELSP